MTLPPGDSLPFPITQKPWIWIIWPERAAVTSMYVGHFVPTTDPDCPLPVRHCSRIPLQPAGFFFRAPIPVLLLVSHAHDMRSTPVQVNFRPGRWDEGNGSVFHVRSQTHQAKLARQSRAERLDLSHCRPEHIRDSARKIFWKVRVAPLPNAEQAGRKDGVDVPRVQIRDRPVGRNPRGIDRADDCGTQRERSAKGNVGVKIRQPPRETRKRAGNVAHSGGFVDGCRHLVDPFENSMLVKVSPLVVTLSPLLVICQPLLAKF